MNIVFQFDNKEYVLPLTKPKGGRWYKLSMDVMIKDKCLWVENVHSKERSTGAKIEVGKMEVTE